MSQGVYLTQMDRIDKYEHKKVYFLSSFFKKKKKISSTTYASQP